MKLVSLSPKSLKDMDSVWQYTYDNWGKKQADTYHSGLRNKLYKLHKQYKKGKAVNSALYDCYFISYKSHYIFYKLDADKITVIRILHKKMDYIRHL